MLHSVTPPTPRPIKKILFPFSQGFFKLECLISIPFMYMFGLEKSIENSPPYFKFNSSMKQLVKHTKKQTITHLFSIVAKRDSTSGSPVVAFFS